MSNVDWKFAEELVDDVYNTPEKKRAMVRVLFKLNAITRSQLETIEKRIDQQEAMAKLRKNI